MVVAKRRQREIESVIEPRNFDIWKADVLISTESNTNQFALVRNGLLLRGQRALYVYIVTIQSTGESLLFLVIASMANNCKRENAKRTTGSRIAS